MQVRKKKEIYFIIKSLRDRGVSLKDISKQYNIAYATVKYHSRKVYNEE